MDFKLVDTVRLQKFKDKLLNKINTDVTAISNSISSEVTARDAAISSAIATEAANRNTTISNSISSEVTARDAAISSAIATEETNRNTAISNAIATEATNRNTAISNAIATEAANRNTAISNAIPTEVSAFQNDSGYLTSHQSLADYAKKTDIPTYTAGLGIKIENGVISVISSKIGNPTCPGYTLYGNYFLSNIITPNKKWNEACNMTENVIVTQNYTLGAQEKAVTARVLSKEELETLTTEQRKISENGHYWYWTSTLYDDDSAWYVYSHGDFYGNIVTYSNDGGGARFGFKNPFI